MAVIDADTHVDECEDTWSFMDPAESTYRPATSLDDDEQASVARPGYTRHWLIDGDRQHGRHSPRRRGDRSGSSCKRQR